MDSMMKMWWKFPKSLLVRQNINAKNLGSRIEEKNELGERLLTTADVNNLAATSA
jgi:HJR/Mrr/RecB family endonuclease